MVFFTSDTHFYHRAIVEYNKRPFASVEEHDEMLIRYWNERVGAADTVYHLGDIIFGGSKIWHSIVPRLNGKIHLVLGNHDEVDFRANYAVMFESVSYFKTLTIEDVKIYMCHFPLLCFTGQDTPNTWNLYGHVHSGPSSNTEDAPRCAAHCFRNQYDVGIDNNNYKPVEFGELKEIINKRFSNADFMSQA